MTKIITAIALLISSMIITSCGEKENKQDAPAPAGMVALDLGKYGKQFFIFVPDTTTSKLEIVEQSWGALEIKVGKNFHVSISEDAGDIELKKSDVKSNDVNKFKAFTIEEPTTIMWESEITKPEFHFYSIQKASGTTYVFEDVLTTDGEPLSKEAIQKMFDSAKTIAEKNKPDA